MRPDLIALNGVSDDRFDGVVLLPYANICYYKGLLHGPGHVHEPDNIQFLRAAFGQSMLKQFCLVRLRRRCFSTLIFSDELNI